MENVLFVYILLQLSFLNHMEGIEMINMKIVEEPSSYGINNFNNQNSQQEEELKMRAPPSNFSGPEHLKRLYGKCFSKKIDSYNYKFCPFSNVTQTEDSYRWNPYKGVLGVWQEWNIKNNTFVSMVMREGDNCGDRFRSVEVFLRCGNKNEIVNVSEPNTCQYHMNFNSPYVCHPHAMLVFPTLSEELRDQWELLEGRLVNEEITEKGYNKRLDEIFVKAGYYLSTEKRHNISQTAIKTELKNDKDNGGFETLYQCTEEYHKLKQQLEVLKMVLKDSKEEKNTKEKPSKQEKNAKERRNRGRGRKRDAKKLINMMIRSKDFQGES